MNFFDETKSLIENLYFLSGPIIAVFGFTVVIQIWLAKKTIVTSSRRQAAEMAAKQVEIYMNQIIPLHNEFDVKEKTLNIPNGRIKGLKEYNRVELEKSLPKDEIMRILNARIDFIVLHLKVLNSMEAFSTYFVQGIADEKIGFLSVGQTFCHSIEKYCFDISFSRDDENAEVYLNLTKLYKLWNSRIKTKIISKELKAKIEEYNSCKIPEINPIGTK